MFLGSILLKIYNVLGQLINQYWIVNFIISSIIGILITEIYNSGYLGGLKIMIKKITMSASFWGCEELV